MKDIARSEAALGTAVSGPTDQGATDESPGIIEGLQTVAGADKVDDYTFQITLKEPDPAIIDSLCYTGGMMLCPAADGQ
jgi:ABC-type transport system substrate-binding protein